MDDSPETDETRTVPDETQAPLTGEETGLHLDAAKVPDELPEQPRASASYGTTAWEQAHGEGLDRKLMQEVPDTDLDANADVVPMNTTREDPEVAPPLPQDDADQSGYDDIKDMTADQGVDDSVSPTSGRPQVPAAAEDEAMHVYSEVPGATDRRASPLEGIPDPDRP